MGQCGWEVSRTDVVSIEQWVKQRGVQVAGTEDEIGIEGRYVIVGRPQSEQKG